MGNSLIKKGVTFASPVYKQRKQGRSPTFATCSSFLRKLRRPPPLPKPKESSASHFRAPSLLPPWLRRPARARSRPRRCGLRRCARSECFPPRAHPEGAAGGVLSLLVGGDAGASAHAGTLRRSFYFEKVSQGILFLASVLLLRAMPTFLQFLLRHYEYLRVSSS